MLEVARKRDLKKCWKTHVTNGSRDTCLQNLLPFRNELTELHEIWNIVSFTHSTNYCSHKYSLDSMCFDQEKLKVENFPKSVTRHMLIIRQVKVGCRYLATFGGWVGIQRSCYIWRVGVKRYIATFGGLRWGSKYLATFGGWRWGCRDLATFGGLLHWLISNLSLAYVYKKLYKIKSTILERRSLYACGSCCNGTWQIMLEVTKNQIWTVRRWRCLQTYLLRIYKCLQAANESSNL